MDTADYQTLMINTLPLAGPLVFGGSTYADLAAAVLDALTASLASSLPPPVAGGYGEPTSFTGTNINDAMASTFSLFSGVARAPQAIIALAQLPTALDAHLPAPSRVALVRAIGIAMRTAGGVADSAVPPGVTVQSFVNAIGAAE